MAEQATYSERLKPEVTETALRSKISARDDFDPEESPKKTAIPGRPKDPEVNTGFLIGFICTLLVGSFHYGDLSWLS